MDSGTVRRCTGECSRLQRVERPLLLVRGSFLTRRLRGVPNPSGLQPGSDVGVVFLPWVYCLAYAMASRKLMRLETPYSAMCTTRIESYSGDCRRTNLFDQLAQKARTP